MLLKFCLATIGVSVFRCADFGWRTFYFHREIFVFGEKKEMGTSTKSKTYNLPANQIFDKLAECLKDNANFSKVTMLNGNLKITAITKPISNLHGEKIIVKILSNGENSSTVSVESSSLIDEYAYGRNSLNVLLMFRTVEQLFGLDQSKGKMPSFANYDREKQATVTNKEIESIGKFIKISVSIILTIALIIGCISIIRSCSTQNDEWQTCHKCDGDGKVVNNLGYNVTCPRCHGVGKLP